MISAFDLTVYELLNDIDVNIQRLLWLGSVARMEEDALARLVFDAGICGSRRSGRPCIRWKDQIEDWCDQTAQAPKKERCLEEINRVVMAN